MGYYADGDGHLDLLCNYEEVPEDIRKYFEEGFDYSETIDDDHVCFGISDKYHEDEVFSSLDKIAPFVKEGYVSFAGENWQEYSGVVCYSVMDFCQNEDERKFLKEAILNAVKDEQSKMISDRLIGTVSDE